MPPSYYPHNTLKETIVIGKTIYEKNSGNPIYRATLAEEIDLKSEGRLFRDLITSSAGYGLTSGSTISDYITLEENGIRVICGEVDAIFDSLFSNNLFKGYYEQYSSGGSKNVPSEKLASDYLKNVHKVPERQIPNILECIIANARDWYLIQSLSGGDKFVPIEIAKEALIKSLGNAPAGKIVDATPPAKDKVPPDNNPDHKKHHDVSIAPSLQVNIQIHIAADTPENKIVFLFENMKKYLLTDE